MAMVEISVIAVLTLAVAAMGFRLLKLRNGGTAALLLDLTADDEPFGRWRHGVMRYRETEAEFYRLSSVRLWPDRRLSRRDVEIVDRRIPRGHEFDIMTAEIVVLLLRDGSRSYEMALDRGALTAFMSWMESRPSPRSQRRSR